MITYVYYVDRAYPGAYIGIQVWRIRRNVPEYLGHKKVDTRSYKGNAAVAAQIISEKDHHLMSNGYKLDSNNIRVLEL